MELSTTLTLILNEFTVHFLHIPRTNKIRRHRSELMFDIKAVKFTALA